MKIHHIRIPLKLRFAQANNATQMSDSVILEVETVAGQRGFGECCPRRYVSGEDASGVMKQLQGIRQQVFAHSFCTIDAIAAWTQQLLQQAYPSAFVCVLELALLDAWSKTYQQPLVEALGGTKSPTLSYSGVVPFGKWENLVKVLRAFQFSSVKFKAGSDLTANLTRVKDIQDLYGKDIPIRLDANGGWSLAEAKTQIAHLYQAGVSSFEQPLARGQEADLAILNDESQRYAWGPLMVDESLSSYQDAAGLVAQHCCQAFNLKISKLGGILQSLRIYRLARQAGIKCQLGAHFGETSILTSAGMVLASVAGELQHLEGGLGTHLLLEDVCSPSLKIDQQGRIQQDEQGQKLGWGLKIDPFSLVKYARRTEFWKVA